MAPAATLRMRLVDDSGAPIAHLAIQPSALLRRTATTANGGAAAQAVEAVSTQIGCPQRLIVKSDKDGYATLAGMPDGWQITLQTPAEDYAPAIGTGLLTIASSDRAVHNVTMEPAGAISGHVRFADGSPAGGVLVGAQMISEPVSARTVADAGGNYKLAGLLPGHYNVAVDESSAALSDDWTAVAREDVTVAGRHVDHNEDMTLRHGTWIDGQILTADGRPTSGEEVGVYGPAHPQSTPWVEAAWPDPDGRFRFRVPPGHSYVYVMTTAEANRGVSIDVPAWTAAHVTLRLAAGDSN
jgi:hypothetical protein